MIKYEIDSEWDDPFEHVNERRSLPRFPSDLKVMIALESGSARRKLVGPGLLMDMSGSGFLCRTKHQLRPGNELTVRFPAEGCPAELCLPKSFYGPAKVVRAELGHNDVVTAAIELGEPLTQNMEFAVYVRLLETEALTR
jgi:hypothetical protein